MVQLAGTQDSSQSGAPSTSGATWDAAVFVWGVWALALSAAVVMVFFGRKYPFGDDWLMVPVWAGEQPVTAAWLWAPHNGHYIPVPKLILLAFYRLSGGDCRAGTLVSILALGALSAALIATAGRLRRGISYTDAFFPLALLHGGHGALSWDFHIHFVISVVLSSILLLILVRQGVRLAGGAACLAGICLLLLLGCGVNGLVLAFPLALGLAYACLRSWGSLRLGAKLQGIFLLGCAVTALFLAALCFRGHEPAISGTDLRTVFKTSLKALSVNFGGAFRDLSPLARLLEPGLLFLGTAVLLVGWHRRPWQRPQILGLLFFLGAILALALTLGWGRGHAWADIHYTMLAVPMLCWVYFTWQMLAPLPASRLVQMGLFTLLMAVYVYHAPHALELVRFLRRQGAAFEHDLLAATPSSVLAQHYLTLLWFNESPEGNDLVTAGFNHLHHAGIGAFRHLAADPALREVALPPTPPVLSRSTLQNGGGRCPGKDSAVSFALQGPRAVAAIRVKFTLACQEPTAPRAQFQISWKNGTDTPGPEGEGSSHWTVGTEPGEKTLTVWVQDTIDQFRIQPDTQPGVFQITQIALLVPETLIRN
jgi:hypothetical protein